VSCGVRLEGDESSAEVWRHGEDRVLRQRVSREGGLRDGGQLPPGARLDRRRGHRQKHHRFLQEGERVRAACQLLHRLFAGSSYSADCSEVTSY